MIEQYTRPKASVSKERRQELYFGRPAQPSVQRPREVEEQQRDGGEEQDGKRQSDFA